MLSSDRASALEVLERQSTIRPEDRGQLHAWLLRCEPSATEADRIHAILARPTRETREQPPLQTEDGREAYDEDLRSARAAGKCPLCGGPWAGAGS